MLDTLLSLPLLSYLLIPAMSSYGTSLNLVFFYITWITLVLSLPPLKVELVGTAAVRFVFYLLPSFTFFLFDIIFPSTAIGIKAQGAAGLPTGKRGRRCGKREAKVVGWAVANLCLGIGVQGLVEVVLTRALGWRSALRIAARLPLPWEVVRGLLAGIVGRELLQYLIHRYILHSSSRSRSLFPATHLTRYHDTWYHIVLKSPYPLTAHYDHPLPYLFGRFLPTFLPAAALRFHLLTYLLYLSLVSLEETFTHSGYSTMPTNFFIGGMARRNELHVLSKGCGNYGGWGLLDWVCGTTVDMGGDDGSDEGDNEDGNGNGEREKDVDIDDVLAAVVEEPKKKAKGLKNRSRKART
ncbi:hypothetical protein AJ79_06208 [Helicocarpus griseus UAMH5409]|uniref:Fatty acid hydroxylase domain-containing protein n=1 Tax=Helicocarpus griseus UAMH5409 TaxID=1447875 RepID=A0A2B7XG32_9EURO|nr:hypothetical protein AJ79_06208 [Helicocarpus griseus UAMH5409]